MNGPDPALSGAWIRLVEGRWRHFAPEVALVLDERGVFAADGKDPQPFRFWPWHAIAELRWTKEAQLTDLIRR